MSSSRARHSLGGTNSLVEDAVPVLWPDHTGCRQVDAAAEEPLELVLDIK